MRVSIVILPEARWSVARHWWKLAEELQFHTAWTYDHLTWRSFQDEAWFGATTTLAAAAIETQTIRIGTLVATPNFRHPVTFAKEVMGLDDLSGGRFTLGLGSGGTGFDAHALGQAPWSMAERTSRFHEFMSHLDTLLRQPASSLHGEHYQASDARSVPGCIQQPRVPFAVSAFGPRGIAAAVKLGQSWITTGPDGLAEASRQVQLVRSACEAAGRPFDDLERHYVSGPCEAERWLDSVESFTDLAGQAAAFGITDIVLHRPRATEPFAGKIHILEAIADRFNSR